MTSIPTPVSPLEDALQHITIELILAQIGDKKNIAPVFSLLTAIVKGSAAILPLHEQAQKLENKVNILLRDDKPWTQEILSEMELFVQWAQLAIDAHKAQQSIPEFRTHGEKAANPQEILEDGRDYLLLIPEEADRDVLVEFFAEMNEHLQQIESSLLALEHNPDVGEHIHTLFRCFHTIKGVSGMLKLLPIQRLTNDIESLLDLARKNALRIDSAIVTVLLEAQDALKLLISQIGSFLQKGIVPSKIIACAEISQKAKAICNRAALGFNETLPTQTQNTKTQIKPSLESNEEVTASKTQTAGLSGTDTMTIRVSTTKLDNLMDRVGELVIVQSQIEDSIKRGIDDGALLNRNLAQLVRISKDLQRTSMAMRMVPIHPTFQKVSRWVRDLSRTMGKPVNFESHGEDTELDRNVIEQIADPLIHMVRNSLDHGIESAQERARAGKPAEGIIQLKAYHLGGNIVIELSDDGRGIDVEKVLEKAIEQGLASTAQSMLPEEIYPLIFAPGLSTAQKVSDLSGRGVGMDVVRRNVEELRGTVDIESEPGVGTTFKIKLPLTMAIIDGLIVAVGKERFILPTTSVKIAIRPSPDQISTLKGKTELLDWRERSLPIVHLSQYFQIPHTAKHACEGIVIIVEAFGKSYALLVDEMLAKQEVVIKSIGPMFEDITGVVGGAILGDGSIALILEPATLCAKALQEN